MRYFIRQLVAFIRYFTRPKPFRWQPVPKRHITPFEMDESVTFDQRKIMSMGWARSPDDANKLMSKYGVSSASELLGKINNFPKGQTFRRKLDLLIKRYEGHVRYNIYNTGLKDVGRIRPTYSYRTINNEE